MAKLSVRELVEFTLHGEDLVRGAGVSAMLDGTVSHKARQKTLGEGWEVESALSLTLPFIEDETLTLSGRMDGYKPDEVPHIEEIKLYSREALPDAPMPAHRAQGVVYGHMVCVLYDVKAVLVTTCYVDKRGRVLKAFDESLSSEECRTLFQTLYEHYLAWHKQLYAHRQKRDALLAALQFPYDAYRKGQREMAVQVFTAIKQRKRLLAEMPTGTGKSAAVLFPALKALGQGHTNQLFYLTARTTQRKAAQECIALIKRQKLSLWTLTLTAKEKQCLSSDRRCDLELCPYAKGFFLRLPKAIEAIMPLETWDEQTIAETALAHEICPFEFSLALSEIADVVIGDYNYAFDPSAHIQRIFDRRRDMTLLVDESHNLMPRVRDMLSATIDTVTLRALKKTYPKRSHAMYKAIHQAQKAMQAFEETGVVSLKDAPVQDAFEKLLNALLDEIDKGLAGDMHFEIFMALKTFLSSLSEETFTYILEGGKATRRLTAFCLSVAEHIQGATKGLCGVVYFSATLSPLYDMKTLLGGEEEDAVFQMPSPFAPEHFFVKRLRVNTRYTAREETADQVAQAIETMFAAKAGKYIAFFPSFKYMQAISEKLSALPLVIQQQGMDEAARDVFLNHFQTGNEAVLGLCVMGGIFSEGIDLPGDQLVGVMLVGVGLPQVNVFQEALRDYFEKRFLKGFQYAYQIPGMHKILQAAGRVIRQESDRGAALLIDDRYYQSAYEKLCPPHWHFTEGELTEQIQLFWANPLA